MHEWVCYILKTCASAIISFFFLLTHVKVKREEASLFFICDISPMYRTLSFRQKKNPKSWTLGLLRVCLVIG